MLYKKQSKKQKGFGIYHEYSKKKIPDAETRARNVARWREVCLMFDNLNLMLSEAIAQGEAELQNSRIYVRRRERVRRQLEDCRQKQLKEKLPPSNN